MSTAANHRKRSHRSQQNHYNSAAILRRTCEANNSDYFPILRRHRQSGKPRGE